MFSLVAQPSDDRHAWHVLQKKAYETEAWALGDNDIEIWKDAFGSDFTFVVAYDCATTSPVGCICSALYSLDSHRTPTVIIGFFFVGKEFRGRGIGNELFQRIVTKFPRCNLYLNGVPSMVEKYKLHHNFNILSDWNNICYQVRRNCVNMEVLKRNTSRKHQVRLLTKPLLDDLLLYDSEIVHGLKRKRYLSKFLMQSNAVSVIATHAGEVVGFGAGRIVIDSEFMIGPLYANSREIAASLLYQILLHYSSPLKQVHLLVPSTNLESISLLTEIAGNHLTSDCYHIGQSTKYKMTADLKRVFSCTEYDLSFV